MLELMSEPIYFFFFVMYAVYFGKKKNIKENKIAIHDIHLLELPNLLFFF